VISDKSLVYYNTISILNNICFI